MPDHFECWDRVTTLREAYRESTKLGFTGEDVEIAGGELAPILSAMSARVKEGLTRARKMSDGIPPTYFQFQPMKWSTLTGIDGAVEHNAQGQTKVRVHEFKPVVLPLFLEGAVKELKLAGSAKEALALHRRIRNSELFDEKLGMYKVNTSLADQAVHIGRTRAYTPGWLENESVFLHMHYKYLLALLSVGLYDVFWEEARRGLVPFFDPLVYGRSVLENSSFIVSSVHPDGALHGRGFVARLSGATAEFMSMWMLATCGGRPFLVGSSGLELRLSPALPGWLFDTSGKLQFVLLGGTTVTFHNARRQDVIPGGQVRCRRIEIKDRSGGVVGIEGGTISEPWASRIRSGDAVSLDYYWS
jgi:hypothetical protein